MKCSNATLLRYVHRHQEIYALKKNLVIFYFDCIFIINEYIMKVFQPIKHNTYLKSRTSRSTHQFESLGTKNVSSKISKKEIEIIDKLSFLVSNTYYMKSEQKAFFMRFYSNILDIMAKGFTLTSKQVGVINSIFEEITKKIQMAKFLEKQKHEHNITT